MATAREKRQCRPKKRNGIVEVELVALTQKSRKFLEDLHIYLLSSGKNLNEIKEITTELEDHLIEAEANGKSIDQIVGDSPSAYMESISGEMKSDLASWAKYFPLVLLGPIAFTIFGDLLDNGVLAYSLFNIIGIIVYTLLFIMGVSIVFKYTSRKQTSVTKEIIILSLPIIVSMLFYLLVLFLDTMIDTPIVNFGEIGSIVLGSVIFILIIAFSIWSKTIIIPVVLLALFLPDILLKETALSESSKLIIGMFITYSLIGLYLFYIFAKEKKKQQGSE